jgi:hypothetical protein
MTTSAVPDLPALCIQEGIDCHVCTSSTARELARACPGLPGQLITRLFVQIHTYEACARMHTNFTRAYMGPAEMEVDEIGQTETRKPIGVCHSLTATAAA